MTKLLTSPLLRKAAFAFTALLVAGTAAAPAMADGYYRPVGWHGGYYHGWHGGYYHPGYGRYWGPRYYGPAYYGPAYGYPAPGVSVWIR
jgi:hypothetical protein